MASANIRNQKRRATKRLKKTELELEAVLYDFHEVHDRHSPGDDYWFSYALSKEEARLGLEVMRLRNRRRNTMKKIKKLQKKLENL